MHKGKHETEKRNFMINQLLKKVIGMVLVLIMLAGNVASPIISIAEELNASGINTNEIVDGDNEVNNGNEGEEDNVIDPQEDKQTQIDYIVWPLAQYRKPHWTLCLFPAVMTEKHLRPASCHLDGYRPPLALSSEILDQAGCVLHNIQDA